MSVQEKERRFYKALKRGASREDAAVEAGFPIQALDVWFRRGSQGIQPYADFVRNVCRLETTYKNQLIGNITKAASGDSEKGIKPSWGAAGFVLERRFGQEFSKLDEQKVTDMMMDRIKHIKDGVVNALIRFVPDESKEEAAEAIEQVFLGE